MGLLDPMVILYIFIKKAANGLLNKIPTDVQPYIKEVYSKWNIKNEDPYEFTSKMVFPPFDIINNININSRIKQDMRTNSPDKYIINYNIARPSSDYCYSFVHTDGTIVNAATASNGGTLLYTTKPLIAFNI